MSDNSNDDVTFTKAQLDEAVANAVAAEKERVLAEVKPKLDAAYKSRDDVVLENETLKAAAKQREIDDLKAKGQIEEAYKLELATAKAQLDLVNKANENLSRDNVIKAAMQGTTFMNADAAEMAFNSIKDSLTKNEAGEWVSKTDGSKNIQAAVADFVAKPSNGFLIKAPTNTGADNGDPNKGRVETKPTSLFNLSQDEVLKRAMEGKI